MGEPSLCLPSKDGLESLPTCDHPPYSHSPPMSHVGDNSVVWGQISSQALSPLSTGSPHAPTLAHALYGSFAGSLADSPKSAPSPLKLTLSKGEEGEVAWASLYSPELLQLSSYLTVPASSVPQRQGLFFSRKGAGCVCV